MKNFLKWTSIVLLVLITGISIVTATRQHLTFKAPYPNIKASTDSNIIARGKALIYGPAHCANCHAPANKEVEVNEGKEVPLSGGIVFDLPIGKLYAKNLTPDSTGIGSVSDAIIARALRYGISRDGTSLFDLMPFHNTSDEDLTAIISYLRQQPAVKNKVPENSYSLLGNIVKAFLLKPAGPTEAVPVSVKRDTSAAYGKYLANSVANCRGCHTNRNLMTGAFTGHDYAGGLRFETQTDSGLYVLTTPNLTPDQTTGRIADWSQQQFINRFRMGKIINGTHMPWGPFSRMSDDELKAIYNFLQTVQPVQNKVPAGIVFEKN